MSIFNPGAAYGEAAQPWYHTQPVVSAATAAATRNQVVTISSNLTDGFKFDVIAGLNSSLVIGVLDNDVAIGGTGQVCDSGVHLVSITTDATPVRGNLLVTSSSKAGALKASTYAAGAEAAGAVVAICLSSTLDSSGTFVSAYIRRV